MSKVQVKLTNFSTTSGVKVKGAVPLNEDDQIKYDEKKFVYVVLKRETAEGFPSFKVEQILTFQITEIDVDTEEPLGEYDEEFNSIQPVQLGIKDYLRAFDVPQGGFKDAWEKLGAQGQREGTLAD